jgi:alkylhydroperoxidase family enzyme
VDVTDPVAWIPLSGLPEAVAGSLVDSYRAIWKEAFDARLLELVRLRIALLLRCDDEFAERAPEALAAGLDEATVVALPRWPTSDLFDERDRIVLGWTEQWLVDVKAITDADAARVQELFSNAQLAQLTLALALFEATIRARVALRGLTEGA